MINAATFVEGTEAFRKTGIATQEQREGTQDEGYNVARKYTFGHLVNRTVQIPEFAPLEVKLRKAKRQRDYFDHHFFREDTDGYSTDKGILALLAQINGLCLRLMNLDKEMREPHKDLMVRHGLPRPTDGDIDAEVASLRQEAKEFHDEAHHKGRWET